MPAGPTTVLKGDVVEEVATLKQELDGDIVVYASYQLGRTLIEHDLVDELRLFVFPVVLGAGERLFGETSDKEAHAPGREQDREERLMLPDVRAEPKRVSGGGETRVPGRRAGIRVPTLSDRKPCRT